MLKLAALGALGYAGYKYYQKNMSENGSTDTPTMQNTGSGAASSGGRDGRPASGATAPSTS